MARKTTRRSPQPTNAQKLWVSCPRDKRWNVIDDIIGRSIKESRDAGERKGHRSETYMRAAVIKAASVSWPLRYSLVLIMRRRQRIQDVIQECQDDTPSVRAQRRAHMHCFKAKLKHLKKPLYAELYSDIQKFKARYERERSLSSEPDDCMDLDSKELEVESGMEVESVVNSSMLPLSTPVKAIIQAHSYPTPESIPRVARLVSQWLPFKLLPSFARRSMDVDILEPPTQYCDVATSTSPVAVEEDVDMDSQHVDVVSSVPCHHSASSSSGEAGTLPRCAGCQQVQTDAIEIDELKEQIKEITETMAKIKKERDSLMAELEESEKSIRARDSKIETLKTRLSKQQDSIQRLLENNANRRRAEEEKRAAVQKELAEVMTRQAAELQFENDIEKLLLEEIDTDNI